MRFGCEAHPCFWPKSTRFNPYFPDFSAIIQTITVFCNLCAASLLAAVVVGKGIKKQ